jgi:hypothetical protein
MASSLSESRITQALRFVKRKMKYQPKLRVLDPIDLDKALKVLALQERYLIGLAQLKDSDVLPKRLQG